MVSRSEAARRRWADPEYRRRQKEAKERGWSEQSRSAQSDRKRADWENPEYREKMAETSESRYTEEVRGKLSRHAIERWQDDEYRKTMASIPHGSGRFIHSEGYIVLTGLPDHPLSRQGSVPEHRKVLYDLIGGGEHECRWCGTTLEWSHPARGRALCVDHLNGDVADNRPKNLVPSCFKCNWDRGKK